MIQFQLVRNTFLIVFCGLAILALSLYKHSNFLHDDALITLRYALNFAQTGLPQWNPGECVEGYTSLLHVVILGGFIRLGSDPISALHITNGIAATGLILLTTYATGLIASKRVLPRMAIVATVAIAPSLSIWILGGLETPVVAAFLMAGLTSLLAHQHTQKNGFIALAALAFCCAILTRLDSAVFITGTGLGFLISTRKPTLRSLLCFAAIVGLPAIVAFTQMAIRSSVYGELFPLTFYAKTDLPLLFRMQNGIQYLLETLLDSSLLLIAACSFLLGYKLNLLSSTITLILTPTAVHLAYVIWSGGDHMPAERMILILIAPLALLVFAIAAKLPKNRNQLLLAATFGVGLFAAINKSPEPMDHAAFMGGIIGRHIDEEWPQDVTIAINTAGATPFYATQNRTFIDMLGLNDPVIAKRADTPIYTIEQLWPGHSKGDGPYVLSRKPERIIIGPAEGHDIDKAWFLSGVEMNKLPEFHRCYTKRTENVHYSKEVAAKGKKRANPVRFTYYVRTCD